MKSLIIALVVLISVPMVSQTDTEIKWYTNLEEAKKIAKQEHKPILLYFTGSDWCAPCIQLKQDFFTHPDFIAKAKDMILVEIDVPRRIDIVSPEQLAYNKEILGQYNQEKAFPKLIALNHKGRVQEDISGYGSLRDPRNYFDLLNRYWAKYN